VRKVSALIVVFVLGFAWTSPAFSAGTPPGGGTIVLNAIGRQIAGNIEDIVATVVLMVSGAALVLAGVMQAQEWERKWLASLSPRERAWEIHKRDAADRRRRRRRRY
jgi:type IV secretory pathway VirB2 component (pilin)